MYLLLFLVGLIGFTAMTALGFLSQGHGGNQNGGNGHSPLGGHGHGAGGHGAISHGHGASGTLHQGPAHGLPAHHTPAHLQHPVDSMPVPPQPSLGPLGPKGGHGHHAPRLHGKGGGKGLSRWFAISPLDLFSFSFGAGAVGILLKTAVGPNLLPWFALIGALVFNFGLVKPIMGAFMRFATTPSEGLEGSVAKAGVAMTRFDKDGRGLVCLTLDGASVQVLATLDRDEIERGVTVAKGDPVTILEVDSIRNTCRVTRELAV